MTFCSYRTAYYSCTTAEPPQARRNRCAKARNWGNHTQQLSCIIATRSLHTPHRAARGGGGAAAHATSNAYTCTYACTYVRMCTQVGCCTKHSCPIAILHCAHGIRTNAAIYKLFSLPPCNLFWSFRYICHCDTLSDMLRSYPNESSPSHQNWELKR